MTNYDINAMIEKLTPNMQAMFVASMSDIKNATHLTKLIEALGRDDLENAMALVPVRPEMFQPLDQALTAAYMEGGAAALSGLPKLTDPFSSGPVVARFDGRNPRAEKWLSLNSSAKITNIDEEQRALVRMVLRQHMKAGTGPQTAALDIVGRYDRVLKRRVGGIIGLTEDGLEMVRKVEGELRSGDPKQLANYLDRKLRDRRFDSLVKRSILSGDPIPAEKARKISGRLADRALYRRGETVGRTELLGSLHEAQDEGMAQMIETGRLEQRQVSGEWDAAEDGDTRNTHANANQQRRAEGDPFDVGGYKMKYPGDRSLGAPAKEIINCRCRKRIHIDFFAT